MQPSFFSTLFAWLSDLAQSELRITIGVCALSLLAVWWPLTRGALLCWRARTVTRPGRDDEGEGTRDRVSALMAEVASSAAAQEAGRTPDAFVRDAAKQIVVDEYESAFAQPISMYANILPPIGFIGTTCGLAVLLLSMRISHDALQLGALALALSSTIFALIGYAILEGFKIHLYARLARSIDAGLQASA
ncbi:MAG: hypothetical protein R3E53_19150 [Myxococcota bacterium]